MRTPNRAQLEEILRKTERAGGNYFSEAEIQQLSIYYALVLKWNKRLHLTTITQPAEFAARHICEADFSTVRLLNSISEVWDLGTGLGVPGIPIALFRPDISVILVDSNRAKAIFLEEAISELQLANANVLCRKVESLDEIPENACLMVRALEKMERLIPEILRIGSKCSQMLIFGTHQTESVITRHLMGGIEMNNYLITGSERRLLIELIRST
ncbi:MAG: 16S rRNA (guanine(527)-N(7))-methyltransferase RsmG [Acidobacteria bacterium]|nr:16S rRNA (guanine(527)-N(7))-methyltransferase RsmG [Acidobacteriota bacterium]MCI0660373.1 16S rRNA (guanine(527)-N(7))-methyltransferase RsmG [Acidobacteriota bacterium]